MDLVKSFEEEQVASLERPRLQTGDVVRVEMRVKEGEKERLQTFEGTILGIRGSGPSATFTVRREVGRFAVERIFPLYNPLITNIEIVKRQKVRRAKLNYLRAAGRRRVKEDEKAMQRHLHEEEDKKRLAALREAQAEKEIKQKEAAQAKAKAEEEKPSEETPASDAKEDPTEETTETIEPQTIKKDEQ